MKCRLCDYEFLVGDRILYHFFTKHYYDMWRFEEEMAQLSQWVDAVYLYETEK